MMRIKIYDMLLEWKRLISGVMPVHNVKIWLNVSECLVISFFIA